MILVHLNYKPAVTITKGTKNRSRLKMRTHKKSHTSRQGRPNNRKTTENKLVGRGNGYSDSNRHRDVNEEHYYRAHQMQIGFPQADFVALTPIMVHYNLYWLTAVLIIERRLSPSQSTNRLGRFLNSVAWTYSYSTRQRLAISAVFQLWFQTWHCEHANSGLYKLQHN